MTAQPITPDRFDAGPIELDEANKEAAANFRRNALAQGLAVAAEDGVTILRPKSRGRTVPEAETQQLDPDDAPTRDPLPAYLELDAGEANHVIVVKRLNKPDVALRPRITFGSARKNGWYQRQINKLVEEGDSTDDESRLDGIIAEVSRLQHAMLRTSIPDLPDGLLDEISPGQMTGIMTAMERIAEETQAESERIAGKVRGQRLVG
jgi:hypothetical protein